LHLHSPLFSVSSAGSAPLAVSVRNCCKIVTRFLNLENVQQAECQEAVSQYPLNSKRKALKQEVKTRAVSKELKLTV
jgi:hypothetical protein